MSSEEFRTKKGATHRLYDDAFKRAAVAQWQSGVPARRVAEGLGITTESGLSSQSGHAEHSGLDVGLDVSKQRGQVRCMGKNHAPSGVRSLAPRSNSCQHCF